MGLQKDVGSNSFLLLLSTVPFALLFGWVRLTMVEDNALFV